MSRAAVILALLLCSLVVKPSWGQASEQASSPSAASGQDAFDEKGLQPSRLTSRDVDPVYAPLRYAIVVGVNQPEDSSVRPLRFAQSDAQKLAAVLSSPAVGAFDKVVLLSAPGRQDILTALDEAQRLLRPNDLFFFYFSGHGTTGIDARLHSTLFLMARDTRLSTLSSSGLSVQEVQTRLGNLKPRRKVMVIDTCYNGDGKSALSAEARERQSRMKGAGTAVIKEPPRESEAHLFAAAVGQPALEDKILGSGVYTWYFLKALRTLEADTNRDGAVSVSEAHCYSRDQTMIHTGNVQVPWASYRIVGREDIYLSGARRQGAERALLYTFNERMNGAKVVVAGQTKGVLPATIELEPGTYPVVVEAPDGTPVVRRTVRLEANQSLDLQDLEAVDRRGKQRARRWQFAGLGMAASCSLGAVATGLQTLSLRTVYEQSAFASREAADTVKAQGEAYRRATNLLLGTALVSGATSGYLRFQAQPGARLPSGLHAQLYASPLPLGGQLGVHLEF